MSSGKKNYFRHSTAAFEDPKIQKAISLLGYEGYAYFFILVELFARQCENEFKNPITLHQQTVRIVLRKSQQSCNKVVRKLEESGLFVVTFTESFYEFSMPNLSKYMGKYESKLSPNVPNKRKEKESKRKETKKESVPPLFVIEKPVLEEVSTTGDAATILTMLNTICFKSFRPTKNTMGFINARLREKYTLDDFAKVIKYKNKQWSEDPRMAAYIRPETLFGSKFDGYLQETSTPELVDPLKKFFNDQGFFGEKIGEV